MQSSIKLVDLFENWLNTNYPSMKITVEEQNDREGVFTIQATAYTKYFGWYRMENYNLQWGFND